MRTHTRTRMATECENSFQLLSSVETSTGNRLPYFQPHCIASLMPSIHNIQITLQDQVGRWVSFRDPYVKSFETASMKFGADISIVSVQMMAKSENATRHSLSMTAAANFHSLQISSPSSCFRKRAAMN
uniref:Uncharacterized protein n=1 Tax=Sphaerodactylus townsendi TaxID=933632 RepID=A0ACB8ESP4_9SAUR